MAVGDDDTIAAAANRMLLVPIALTGSVPAPGDGDALRIDRRLVADATTHPQLHRGDFLRSWLAACSLQPPSKAAHGGRMSKVAEVSGQKQRAGHESSMEEFLGGNGRGCPGYKPRAEEVFRFSLSN